MAFNNLGLSDSFFFLVIKNDPRYREGMTVRDISYEIVKPDTKEKKCAFYEAYLDKCDENGRLYVSPATEFLSYAREYDYNKPLDVIIQKSKEKPNSYFWFDLFICSQHGGEEKTFHWWQTTFCEAIINIGSVLIVMSPWNSPVVLRRAWCLWEIFCSINAGSKVAFQICLPTSERTALKEGISKNFNSILDALIAMDAQNAEAVKPKDRDMIFAVIKKEVGFDVLNNMVKDQLRKWYVETGANIADVIIQEGGEESKSKKSGNFFFNLGIAFIEFHKYDEALRYFNHALNIKLSSKGSIAVAHIYTGIAHVKMALGTTTYTNIQEAVALYQRVLNIKLATLGSNHRDTGTALFNLANANFENYRQGARLIADENIRKVAISDCQRAIKIFSSLYDENHPDISSAYHNLARMTWVIRSPNSGTIITTEMKKQDDLTDSDAEDWKTAVSYYEKSIKLSTIRGRMHPDTGLTYVNLGNAYKYKKRNLARAIECYELALKIQLSTVGELHGELYNNLAIVHKDNGDWQKALTYLERHLEIQLNTLGDEHPETKETRKNIRITNEALKYINNCLLANLCGCYRCMGHYAIFVVSLPIEIIINTLGCIVCPCFGWGCLGSCLFRGAVTFPVINAFKETSIHLGTREYNTYLSGEMERFQKLDLEESPAYDERELADTVAAIVTVIREPRPVETNCFLNSSQNVAIGSDDASDANVDTELTPLLSWTRR